MALKKVTKNNHLPKRGDNNQFLVYSSQFNDAIDELTEGTADLTVNDATVSGDLTVTGTSTFNGTIVLGDAAADALTVTATTTYGEPINYDSATTITVFATGGQASATALTAEINNVTTVATAGDSVKLPAAVTGKHIYIKNSGATALDIFPATSDSIDALAVNLAIRIQPGSSMHFYAKDAIVWESSIDNSITLNSPTTATGQLEIKATASAGNTVTTITNASQAAGRTYTIPDAGANASFLMTSGAQTITKAAADVALTIDADTTDSTVDIIDIDLGVNSSSVNAIDISADVKTALSAGEIVNSIKIDSNSLAADADTSAITGVDVTLSAVATSRADLKGVNVTLDGTMDTADSSYGVVSTLGGTRTEASENAGLFVDVNLNPINHASATAYGIIVDTRDLVITTASETAAMLIRTDDDSKGIKIDAATVDHTAGNLVDIDADVKDIVSGSLKGANINIDETVAGTDGTAIYSTDTAITGFATGRADLVGHRVVFDGTKSGGDTTKGVIVNADAFTINNASETFAGIEVDASGLTNTASTSVEGIVVSMPAVGTGTAAVGINITMNATTEMALSTNAEVRCAEISSAASLITSMVTPTVGTGFDGAAVAKWVPYGTFGIGGAKVAEFIFDLTNLVNSTTADDIIGETATANCHYGQITAAVHGTIFAMEITCLETPAGGDPDIDFYSATESTGTENALVTDLTETLLLARGASWAINDYRSVVTALPAADQYLYLAVGSAGGAPGTYSAGKFKIKFYGV